MANWSVLVVEVACLLLALVDLGMTEAIMCSRCQSKVDQQGSDCETNPPEPTRCSVNSNTQQYCIIAREMYKNGTLLKFIRDCSTSQMGDECKVLPETGNKGTPHKICYKTCATDGCNPAPPTTTPLALPLMLTIGLASQWLLVLRAIVWSLS